MQYGLTKVCIEKILSVFKRYGEIDEALLYGSRAKGNFQPGSDIDLSLKGEGLNLALLNKISLELDDLMLPYTFDLSIYRHIENKDLLDHIQRVGRAFYIKT